jgi:NAD(P)-dependent dehydrogenase (short-subunit alcohol dehydrogenase family)
MNTNYSHLFRLDGRHALVVGAGSGIGREAALALAAHGALVVCADTRIDSAIETASMADGLTAASLDVLDTTAVDLFVQKNSNIDVLVHTPAMNVRKAILDYSLEEFDRVVGLNLRSTFYMIQSFGRKMVARERGSIITFSSIRAATVEPGQSIYAATKSGLESIVRTAAAEFGVYGVRVNAIRPGVVETPLTDQLKNNPEWYDAYAQKSALGRWAKADEIAGAVVYLASDASSFVTGTTITVDGGWTAIDGRYTPPL